jgi:hypothetical protein
VELLIVIAIVGLLMTGISVGLRSLARTELRTSAGRVAAAIRYVFDRALTTGKTYRMVFDLSEGVYWVEDSKAAIALPGGKGAVVSRTERRRAQLGAAQDASDPLAPFLRPPPAFALTGDRRLLGTTGKMALRRGARFRGFWAMHQEELITEAKGQLYFFPQGMTEAALIQLGNDDETLYTLRVHPLDGRVEILSGKVDPEAENRLTDDAGREIAP